MGKRSVARVGSRELKTRLGSYLRLVQSGQRIVVTDRGRAVAELVPIVAAADDVDAQMAALAAAGRVTPPTRDDLEDVAAAEPVRGRSLAETIRSEREDRF